MSKKRWQIHTPNTERLAYYRKHTKLPEPILHALDKLGVDDVYKFFDFGLRNLTDPYDIPNMEKACERLQLAITRNEKIVVFGDYDLITQ